MPTVATNAFEGTRMNPPLLNRAHFVVVDLFDETFQVEISAANMTRHTLWKTGYFLTVQTPHRADDTQKKKKRFERTTEIIDDLFDGLLLNASMIEFVFDLHRRARTYAAG